MDMTKAIIVIDQEKAKRMLRAANKLAGLCKAAAQGNAQGEKQGVMYTRVSETIKRRRPVK